MLVANDLLQPAQLLALQLLARMLVANEARQVMQSIKRMFR